jgi:S-adenosylmethionine decarboxylase
VTRDGMTFAGAHLIVDLWGASGLNDLEHVEEALRQAVSASGATLLHVHLHHFTPNGGISGVAVLAESHISIHTWPERSYAALDIFMCGAADPQKAVPVLDCFFKPARIEVEELRRGRVK